MKVEITELPPQTAAIPHAIGFAQTNWRKMYLGTALPHLQEGRGGQTTEGLEWQQAERLA